MSGVAVLCAMNLLGVRNPGFLMLAGITLWVCMLKSGVHATFAGVALGFDIPNVRDAAGKSPLITL